MFIKLEGVGPIDNIPSTAEAPPNRQKPYIQQNRRNSETSYAI